MRKPRLARAGNLSIMPSLRRFAMDMNSRRIVFLESGKDRRRHRVVMSLWSKRRAAAGFCIGRRFFVRQRNSFAQTWARRRRRIADRSNVLVSNREV